MKLQIINKKIIEFKKIKLNLSLIFLISMLMGCMNYGENIELSGKEVDSNILSKVSKLTEVLFPEGAVGKKYVYFGEGLDDSLAIKVSIPRNKKDEFLKNTIFTNGKNELPHVPLLDSKSWWDVQSLTDPVHTGYDFPNGNRIECSIGEEFDQTTIYLHWITI